MRAVRVEHLADGGAVARFSAMASPCEVIVDGADEVELQALSLLAAQECWRIESKWSRYRSDNIVHAINSANGRTVEVDPETARLIDFAVQLHEGSEGRFDLSAGVLRRAWKFDRSAAPPTQEAVEALLRLVGWHRVSWRAPMLRLLPGMEIDFGGVGKEYAVDRAAALLSTATDKPALVNLGGDLAANRPRQDGAPWRVGIDSGVEGTATPLIRLARGAVATSGDHHRHVVGSEHRYGHIIDPRTGWPPPRAPRSVTVACDSCIEAGAMSTIAVLYGGEAERWLGALNIDAHVVR